MSIGRGAQAQVTAQIQSLGTNLLFIRPGASKDQGVRSGAGSAPTLTLEDSDAIALLRLGAANGFFGAALLGLLRMLASDYWRLRQRAGLTRYGEAAMMQKLNQAGFSARCAPDNIGHIQSRMTFIARPR